jgi:hypothetical protein
MNMAFGQRADVFISSWGVAPGYGEGGLRPESQTAIAQFGRHQSAGVEGRDSGTTSPTAARFANKSGWPTESPRGSVSVRTNVTVNVAAASKRSFQVRRDPPLTFNRYAVF